MASIDYSHSFYRNVEIRFKCSVCETTIDSGIVEFPTPDTDSESHASSIESDGECVDCPNCGKEYDITVHAGINGSGVEISDIEDEDVITAKTYPPDYEIFDYNYTTMFRLINLYIDNFKNIKQQTFDFSNHNGLTLLIGNNSSGKSNLIEAICGVFYSLYERYEWRKPRSRAVPNNFKISYHSGTNCNIAVSNGHFSPGPTLYLAKKLIHPPLPMRIVAIYSGEEDRLKQHYFDPFLRVYKQQQQEGVPYMMFLNKGHWDIALVCLLYSDKRQETDFLSTLLRGFDVKRIIFNYSWRSGTGTPTSTFINRLKDAKMSPSFSIEDLLSNIDEYEDATSLFQYLYIAKTHKYPLLNNITFEFNIDSTEEETTRKLSRREAAVNSVGLQSLSEGQKKLILITAALEFAGQDNTLFLLDEPDAHVHLSRKHTIIDIVKKYTHNRHVIITTHSPTLCRYIANKDSIMMLENGKPRAVGDQIEAAIDLVGDRSAIDIFFSTKHIILVEGKTDCIYISKAIELHKDDYPELFGTIDFITIGGSDGEIVRDFIAKISIRNGRKVILIVDRDDAGLKCAKTVLNNNTLEKDNIDIAKIDNDLHIIMLPNPSGVNKDTLIEDYFGITKIRALITDKINSTTHFTGLPDKGKKYVKDKLKEFAENEATNNDMVGFKILLDKIKAVLDI